MPSSQSATYRGTPIVLLYDDYTCPAYNTVATIRVCRSQANPNRLMYWCSNRNHHFLRWCSPINIDVLNRYAKGDQVGALLHIASEITAVKAQINFIASNISKKEKLGHIPMKWLVLFAVMILAYVICK